MIAVQPPRTVAQSRTDRKQDDFPGAAAWVAERGGTNSTLCRGIPRRGRDAAGPVALAWSASPSGLLPGLATNWRSGAPGRPPRWRWPKGIPRNSLRSCGTSTAERDEPFVVGARISVVRCHASLACNRRQRALRGVTAAPGDGSETDDSGDFLPVFVA